MLQLLGTGASPRDVADRLVLSVSTVKTHMRSLFRKLEVGTPGLTSLRNLSRQLSISSVWMRPWASYALY